MADVVTLRAALELLLISVVIPVTLKLSRFSSDLDRLRSTLRLIQPIILEHDELVTRAENMVHRCSQLKWWRFFMRLYYSVKLIQLEAELLILLQVNVVALSVRVSATVSQLEEKVDEAIGIIFKLYAVANCDGDIVRDCGSSVSPDST
ncbi:RNA ligase/cyclic nucleotide phosphodiesterasefamily protein [Striga asiatica]|uniref:RNA ligase/cyclic nucleotide phosphodiesterasefamily protein n=1 Tax=Striga asiatica TaxID=4170 RepID=A0A5A7QU58_STRAF|nr:RNA ligase/cyclic nucleotide phosphodiesterasefamily protein [Striga asiatica]